MMTISNMKKKIMMKILVKTKTRTSKKKIDNIGTTMMKTKILQECKMNMNMKNQTMKR